MQIEVLIREFVSAFEHKDVNRLAAFFHDDIVFENYGDAEVRGKHSVAKVWERVFAMFETVRFETIAQATNGPIVLAEQYHHLGLPGRVTAPIRNMARYEIKDGRIAVWHDYTDSKYAKHLLEATKPLAM